MNYGQLKLGMRFNLLDEDDHRRKTHASIVGINTRHNKVFIQFDDDAGSYSKGYAIEKLPTFMQYIKGSNNEIN